MADTDDATNPVPNAPPLFLHVLYQTAGMIAFFISVVPVLLFRTVLHIFPRTRPHPKWSLRRDLAVAIGRLYLACSTYFALPRPHGKKAWKVDPTMHKRTGKGTKVKMVEVPPVGQDWIVGVAQVGQGLVKPEPVACFWTFCPTESFVQGDEKAQKSERVILYVAGGSWVMGHPQSTMFPYKFAKVSGHRVLSCNHRKALSPSSAAPAQLLDISAAYAYLLAHGFAAQNITIIGDSSGGHLLLALSRYLSELRVELPGGMLLISPSCDLGHAPHGMSSTDYLVPYLNDRAIPSLVRHYPPTSRADNPYFSPAACGSFAWLAQAQKERGVRVWIQYGSVENLRGDIDRLVQRMRADGVDVDVDLVEGGVHLDAGIAYALRERGPESSWTRLLEAVRTYA